MTSPPRLFPFPRIWTPADGTVDTSHLHSEEDLAEIAMENPFRPSEGYRIDLSEDRISLEIGGTPALRYAWDHVQQLQGENPTRTPCGLLEDAPALPRRGFMLDISRCKVPTREGLLQWLRLLRGFRYNELQLYTEHTFAYEGHETVWKDASPITPDDVLWLQKEAAGLGIELVPNQNCFGHFERWIKHDAYRKFAESPDGFITPWGTHRTVGSVLKPDEVSFELVTGLLDQLLPLFRSNRVNIGCDETFELGQGASRERCEQEGMGAVYAGFVNRIMTYVLEKYGKQPEFWGDIILKAPEELTRLPHDAVALDWGYEKDSPFPESCKTFSESGYPFAVCPGTSSWTSIAGRTDNMTRNIQTAITEGIRYGAQGVLLTDWGDWGHLQLEQISYPALAWNGLMAWEGVEADQDRAWEWCDQVAFEDQAGDTACWLAAGRISASSGVTPGNASLIFKWFQDPGYPQGEHLSMEAIEELIASVEGLTAPNCYREEWEQTLRNLSIGLFRAIDHREGTKTAEPLIEEALAAHARLWRKRNREGGLAESLEHYTNPPNQ